MTAKTDEPLSIIRQLELMRDLQRLANERAEEEARISRALADGLREAEQARAASDREVEARFASVREAAREAYERARREAQERYEQERNTAQHEYKGLRENVETEHSRVLQAALSEQQDLSWETLAVFDAIKGKPRERLLEAIRRLRDRRQELAVLEGDATAIMKMRRQWREFPTMDQLPNDAVQRVQLADPPDGNAEAPHADAADAAAAAVDRATSGVRDAVMELYQQRLPRLFESWHPAGMFLGLWLAAAVACGAMLGWSGWLWPTISVGLAAMVTAGLMVWLYPRARQQSGEQFVAVRRLLARARREIDVAAERAHERGRSEAASLIETRDRELAAVEQKLEATRSEKDRWKDTEIGQAGSVFPSRLAELRSMLDRALSAAESGYNESLAQLTRERDRQTAENLRQNDERCRGLRTAHDQSWEALAQRWLAGYDAIRDAWGNMNAQCERLFPDWDATDEQSWPRPSETAPAIAFGKVRLELASIKRGLPQDDRLRPARTALELPALMTLKEHPVMVIAAEDEGRRAAVDVLVLMMLRFLTAMPPGKVRFTILDPIGLGENFASFMHLADFDEKLIAGRIWTEPRQVEEQLGRLTAHMETVLQKYLRNEFATIDDYNREAGEVAEPFQVLVVANFPANFSEAAARKLISIGTSGPRCGVYTLLGIDRRQRIPNDVALDDLLANAVHLDWVAGVERQQAPSGLCEPQSGGSLTARPQPPDKGQFRWRYPAFERLPLTLDRPPSAERLNEVVRAAGRAAKDSMRVEVPFEIVAPSAEETWQGDNSHELAVPIGRAGAMRLQSVRLGRGTAQHLLVAGKTGSGKSTFLHALVTNTALHYSPEQVEFYLIDFKKGVEFKTYATHRLPHARVIAIESEREFGHSVLERLDGELRRRGELFRMAGVQGLAGYREAKPGERIPRVLLVIDEFQELFVEDDKLAQDSALLLDRLVRQGRAFGIHVLLGSQTLSGAYSLARSTMGQMAVRVALQCSEADSHLILSDERNMAARYLSRPGEAIYNDQNGLLAGNQPFQVVWLPEPRRIEYLRQIEQLAAERGESQPPAIVFEGNQPADPAENGQLREVLENPPSSPPAVTQAWLGAAVAIKEPTCATLTRNAGSNLLVVGGEVESALGVLANAVIAMAAQHPGDCPLFSSGEFAPPDNREREKGTVPFARKKGSVPAARFVVLDGSRPDSAFAGIWQRLADALPVSVTVSGPRDTARAIGEVAEEVARREAAGEEDAPPLVVVVYNAGRFRDLRRGEEDFGFSLDRDKPPRPDRQWCEILRNGPAWGVHSFVWCDSYGDVNRLVDRQTLREFELRIVFQMSAADSTNLLDTPAASRLRLHRGLFYSDDLGTLEKFRPYGPPSDAWLAEVRDRLHNAANSLKVRPEG